MNDKFTLRDFFAYFFCGCGFFIALLFFNFNKIFYFYLYHSQLLKDNSTLIIFILLPIFYFTGQIIQSIDTPFYILGSKIWYYEKDNPDKFLKILYKIISSHRITGKLNEKEINSNDFWFKCNELSLISKYDRAEYSYIMNDLFKGLVIIVSFFSLYSFILLDLKKGFVFLFFTFLFWTRARYFATIFIDTVVSTRKALDNIKTENVK